MRTQFSPNMSFQMRSAASAVEVQGIIYVLGGYDPHARGAGHNTDRLDVVERFDPMKNTWEKVITQGSHA